MIDTRLGAFSNFENYHLKLKDWENNKIEKLTGTIFYKLNNNPKTIFIVDGFGALLTAFLLFGVLRPFDVLFGMPKDILVLLSLIALAFAIYSFSCYFFLKANWKPFLIVISIANFLYCCLTLGLVYYLYSELTGLGVAYFLVEVVVLMALVMLEWRLIKYEN